MSVADVFEVSDGDTVWDAWLTAVNLLDMLERSQQVGQCYDFAQARSKLAKVYSAAEAHAIDRHPCSCGLSEGEHALLKRKILAFFKLQVSNLKRFLY